MFRTVVIFAVSTLLSGPTVHAQGDPNDCGGRTCVRLEDGTVIFRTTSGRDWYYADGRKVPEEREPGSALPKSRDKNTAVAEKKLDESRPPKCSSTSTVTISTDGLLRVEELYFSSSKTFVYTVPITELDPKKNDTSLSMNGKLHYARLRCRSKDCIEWSRPYIGTRMSVTMESSVSLCYEAKVDAVGVVRAINSQIEQWTK